MLQRIEVIKSMLQRTKVIKSMLLQRIKVIESTLPKFREKAQANKDYTEVCTVFSANYGVGVFDHKSKVQNRTLA